MNQDEFQRLVDAHYEALYRFGISLTRSEADACDLTQQTFFLWAKKGHQLRDRSKAKSWLFTTLHRAFLGRRRKETRFPHHEYESVQTELPVVSPDIVTRLDGQALLEAAGGVDEIFRAPLMLFYLEDLSYKEIAEILDVPIGTVMSRLARGKTQLRRAVRDAAEAREGVPADKIVCLPSGKRERGQRHG